LTSHLLAAKWIDPNSISPVVAMIALLLLVCVLGYLAHEKRRRRRAEAALTISCAVGKTQSELEIRKSVGAILGAILDLFNARRVVLVLMDAKGERSFLWKSLATVAGQPSTDEFSQLPASQAQRYFLAGPDRGWSAIQLRRSAMGEPLHCLVLDEASKRACDFPSSRLGEFLILNDFRSLLGVAFSLGKWSGRLFVLDPSGTAAGEAELRFLQALVWEVGSSVHNQYLLRNLRSRVRAVERARLARELHDGVVQSLAGVEMRLAALRRTIFTDPGQALEAVAQAQQVVRDEILAVRDLMEQIKPIELSSKELLGCLDEIVDRFRRDTAISASFVSDFEQVSLAPRVCSELVRIAQEALFNVRKHSLANNVLVRLAGGEGYCQLVIEDDGRGFEFSGRFSQAQLEATRKGPRVIKERVRSIGGELVIDSMPGRGARLEISVPQRCYG
jgi:signal transduction histidine kinase